MIILFISSIINEIVDIHINPDSVYQTVWGLFRFFTIDGNLLSCIFNCIISFKQYKALRLTTEKDIKEKIISHFLYIISLISVCDEIIIFVVVMFIFLPTADSEWTKGLIGTYKASSVHITIPLILTFRFLFLDSRERDLKLYEKFVGGIPMIIYGAIMYTLCCAKVFTSYYKEEGDAKIPYPFFDVYHKEWYFCLFIAIFIFIFGFGISFLFDFLNKKLEKLIFPYDLIEEENDVKEERLFTDS
jgi:hypothetical protein